MNAHDIPTIAHIQALENKLDILVEQVTKLTTTKAPAHAETFLRAKDVQHRYNISKTHLYNLKIKGIIPFSNILGVDLYPQSKIDELVDHSLKK